MVDVTDATFETEVLARSEQVPVVVDLWATWCGPCRTLGPIIERVVAATGGDVVLAKVDVDANPRVGQMFQVQSIPAVYAIKNRQVVDHFLGAKGEREVAEFVARLRVSDEERAVAGLIEAGDETALRQALELSPGHEGATLALARVLVESGRGDEALTLLESIPETLESRHIAALARNGDQMPADIDAELTAILASVKGDDEARQKFLDLLELLGPDDPRTAQYRKKLTAALF